MAFFVRDGITYRDPYTIPETLTDKSKKESHIENTAMWIYEKDINGKCVSMKLVDEEYNKHFGIVNNFHNFLNERGYVMSNKVSYSLENFIEDDSMTSFAYLVACCDDKSIAEELVKWMVGPLREVMNEKGYIKPTQFCFHPPEFTKLVNAVVKKQITATMGKEVLRLMANETTIEECLEMDKFKVQSNDEIVKIIKTVFDANPDQVAKAKVDPKLIGWLVGQVMKASGGKANAAETKDLIIKELSL